MAAVAEAARPLRAVHIAQQPHQSVHRVVAPRLVGRTLAIAVHAVVATVAAALANAVAELVPGVAVAFDVREIASRVRRAQIAAVFRRVRA